MKHVTNVFFPMKRPKILIFVETAMDKTSVVQTAREQLMGKKNLLFFLASEIGNNIQSVAQPATTAISVMIFVG